MVMQIPADTVKTRTWRRFHSMSTLHSEAHSRFMLTGVGMILPIFRKSNLGFPEKSSKSEDFDAARRTT